MLLGGWIPPLMREGDIHIGNLPSVSNINLSLSELHQFHQVFQYLRITTLSDIVCPSGSFLCLSAWNCLLRCNSNYKWPNKSFHISNSHKRIWHRVLSAVVSPSKNRHRQW